MEQPPPTKDLILTEADNVILEPALRMYRGACEGMIIHAERMGAQCAILGWQNEIDRVDMVASQLGLNFKKVEM